MSKSILPMFFSRNVMVSGLIFKFLTHIQFIFVHGVREQSSLIHLHRAVQFSQQYLLKRLPFLFFKIFLLQLIYNVLSISAVQQSDPVIYIYIFFSHYLFLTLSSTMAHQKCLDIVPCAIQQDLIAHPFQMQRLHLSTPNAQSIPLPPLPPLQTQVCSPSP